MVVTYILVLAIVLLSCRVNKTDFNEDFAGKEQSNAVKGIFIWLVFISHIAQYIPDIDDKAFTIIRETLGQMIVVPFLFYSGYGVLTNIKKTGKDYVNSMPKKRLLVTLANFDVAVIVFILLNLALGIGMNFKQCALSFICWDSVGNSNWYIFAILICYLATYLCAKVWGCSRKSIIALCICIVAYIAVMSFFKSLYWYDTALAYAAGAVYAFYKEEIDDFLKRRYWLTVAVSIAVLLSLFFIHDALIVVNNLKSVALMAVILLIAMRVRLHNRFLQWSGNNLFPLYIYQRVPMLVLATVADGYMVHNQVVLYIASCFLITLLIAWSYRYFKIALK